MTATDPRVSMAETQQTAAFRLIGGFYGLIGLNFARCAWTWKATIPTLKGGIAASHSRDAFLRQLRRDGDKTMQKRMKMLH